MKISWSQFKTIYESRNMDLVLVESDLSYDVHGVESGFSINCLIFKGDTDECTEFEQEYLPFCNMKRQLFDGSGKPFARFAIATEGFMLSCLATSFCTAKLNSLHCKMPDNVTDAESVTYKMFDADGDETFVDANAVKTQIDIEVLKDYEMVGGKVLQAAKPTENVYGYMIAAPDIPEAYGGSKNICKGGFNFKFIDGLYEIDGRAPKMMYYDASLHTNKIRLLFYHPAGYQHDLMFNLEYYR